MAAVDLSAMTRRIRAIATLGVLARAALSPSPGAGRSALLDTRFARDRPPWLQPPRVLSSSIAKR